MPVLLPTALKVMLILKDFSDYSAAQNNIAGLVHLLMMNIFFCSQFFPLNNY